MQQQRETLLDDRLPSFLAYVLRAILRTRLELWRFRCVCHPSSNVQSLLTRQIPTHTHTLVKEAEGARRSQTHGDDDEDDGCAFLPGGTTFGFFCASCLYFLGRFLRPPGFVSLSDRDLSFTPPQFTHFLAITSIAFPFLRTNIPVSCLQAVNLDNRCLLPLRPRCLLPASRRAFLLSPLHPFTHTHTHIHTGIHG